MPDFATVSEVARQLEAEHGCPISPRVISDLFYRRELRDDLCPIVGGRRLIPRDYVCEIERALRQHHLIRPIVNRSSGVSA